MPNEKITKDRETKPAQSIVMKIKSIRLKSGVEIGYAKLTSTNEHVEVHEKFVAKHIPKPKRIPIQYYEEIDPKQTALGWIDGRVVSIVGYIPDDVPIVNEGGRMFFVHTWK